MRTSSPWILQCRSPTQTGWSSWGNACIYTYRAKLPWIIRDLMKYHLNRLPDTQTMWRLKHCLTGEIITPKDIECLGNSNA